MNVYLYTARITHHVSWRFTILLSEIERQLVIINGMVNCVLSKLSKQHTFAFGNVVFCSIIQQNQDNIDPYY